MQFDAPAPAQFESLPCHTLATPFSLRTSTHCAYKVFTPRTDAFNLRSHVPCNTDWGRSAWLSDIDFRYRTHFEAPAAHAWPTTFQPVVGDVAPRAIQGTRNPNAGFLWLPTNANE